MSGFRSDLISEIKFAKQYFDFTEITIQPDLLQNIDDIFVDLKEATNGFEVLGHIHWNIVEPDEIKKNIELLKILGAKKITIHPFENLSVEGNAEALNRISNFTQEHGLDLLIENVTKSPFNAAETISELLEKIPNAGLTLDIRHANKFSELDKFIELLGSKIRHIHLHDNVGDFDHMFYDDQERLSVALSKIKSFDYNGTVLLETFSVKSGNKNVSQEFPEIMKLHIEQIKKLKNTPE